MTYIYVRVCQLCVLGGKPTWPTAAFARRRRFPIALALSPPTRPLDRNGRAPYHPAAGAVHTLLLHQTRHHHPPSRIETFSPEREPIFPARPRTSVLFDAHALS